MLRIFSVNIQIWLNVQKKSCTTCEAHQLEFYSLFLSPLCKYTFTPSISS